MDVDSTHLFYGVRYQISDQSEVKQIQTGEHLLLKAAKKVGLESMWGNFDLNGGEYYLLYIGPEISIIGYEGKSDLELSDAEFTRVQIDVRRKLAAAGFSLVPALLAQFEPDI